MSGSIDEYRFEDVTKDTLYVMRDIRRTIDGWAKRTHEIDLEYNPYEGRDEREKLDMVVTKNIVDSVKDILLVFIAKTWLLNFLTTLKSVLIM